MSLPGSIALHYTYNFCPAVWIGGVSGFTSVGLLWVGTCRIKKYAIFHKGKVAVEGKMHHFDDKKVRII